MRLSNCQLYTCIWYKYVLKRKKKGETITQIEERERYFEHTEKVKKKYFEQIEKSENCFQKIDNKCENTMNRLKKGK